MTWHLGQWAFVRNPDRSWWNRHTSLKLSWPQVFIINICREDKSSQHGGFFKTCAGWRIQAYNFSSSPQVFAGMLQSFFEKCDNYTTLLGKYLTFFLWKPGGLQWDVGIQCACTRHRPQHCSRGISKRYLPNKHASYIMKLVNYIIWKLWNTYWIL